MSNSSEISKLLEITELVVGAMGHILILIGCFFILTSVIGIKKFNDTFAKIHAASVSDSLGLPLCYFGLFLMNISSSHATKYLFIALMCLIFSPLISHSIAYFIHHNKSD